MLERAVKKVKSLPYTEQDSTAAIILEELEDEARWEQTFLNPQRKLAKLAAEAREEYRNGETKELDPDSL